MQLGPDRSPGQFPLGWHCVTDKKTKWAKTFFFHCKRNIWSLRTIAKMFKYLYYSTIVLKKSVDTHMISVSLQWELGGKSSTLSMSFPMRRLSVSMQRQRWSTPRPLRLIPKRKKRKKNINIRYVFYNLVIVIHCLFHILKLLQFAHLNVLLANVIIYVIYMQI